MRIKLVILGFKLLLGVLRYLKRQRIIREVEADLLRQAEEVANEFATEARAARHSVLHDADSVRCDPFNRDRQSGSS